MHKSSDSAEKFHDLTIGDLRLLSDLPHFTSLRAFARSRQTQLSQISRLIKKLETTFGSDIVDRSPSGIGLTQFGKEICARAAEVSIEFRKFSDVGYRAGGRSKYKIYSLASQGFINFIFSPLLVALTQKEKPSTALRFLDLSADEMVLAAKSGAIDIILNIGEIDLGKNWSSHYLGDLGWRLYVRPGHPLLKHSDLRNESLKDYIIITETLWDGFKINTNEGFFPSKYMLKVGGYESETAITAVGIASASDHLAYVPEILVSYLGVNRLTGLDIPGFKPVAHPLYLSVEINSIPQKFLGRMIAELRAAIPSLVFDSRP